MSVGLCLRLRIPREPWAFVFASALPAISKAIVGPGALFNRCSVIRVLSRGYKRDLSGSQATHPAPLPCSETPAESVILALPDFPMLPPVPTRRRLQRAHDFEANTRLRYPLSTLHERRCRHPCKTRFRLAGSAFAGRASNPLGHKERFQATSILLSRAYPDASWSHVRRRFYELAAAGPAPIAGEALQRIASLYEIEAEIRGRSAAPFARRRAGRSSTTSSPGCEPSSPSSARKPSSQRRSAMRSHAGTGSAASSKTAASKSTPISSSGRSVPSHSIARTPYSRAPMAVPSIGP